MLSAFPQNRSHGSVGPTPGLAWNISMFVTDSISEYISDRFGGKEMLHLSAETVHRQLDYPGLITALRKAHAAERMPQSKTQIMNVGNGNDFVSLIAWLPGKVIAVKLVGVFPANPSLP